MTPHTTHPTSLGTILTRSHRVCLQAATRRAGEQGLTYPQFRVLETLFPLARSPWDGSPNGSWSRPAL